VKFFFASCNLRWPGEKRQSNLFQHHARDNFRVLPRLLAWTGMGFDLLLVVHHDLGLGGRRFFLLLALGDRENRTRQRLKTSTLIILRFSFYIS
jgi:hypothetical protein